MVLIITFYAFLEGYKQLTKLHEIRLPIRKQAMLLSILNLECTFGLLFCVLIFVCIIASLSCNFASGLYHEYLKHDDKYKYRLLSLNPRMLCAQYYSGSLVYLHWYPSGYQATCAHGIMGFSESILYHYFVFLSSKQGERT